MDNIVAAGPAALKWLPSNPSLKPVVLKNGSIGSEHPLWQQLENRESGVGARWHVRAWEVRFTECA